MNTSQTITDLQSKIADIAAQRAAIAKERARHALKATQGPGAACNAARAEIAKLDAEETRLDRELQTLEDAITQLKKPEYQEAARAHEADWALRLAEADKIAGELLKASSAADDAIGALVAALERRRELARWLRATGVVPNGVGNHLAYKHVVDRALGCGGLRNFAETIGAASGARSLSESDAIVVGSRLPMPPYEPGKEADAA